MSPRVVFWPSYPVISTTLSGKIVGGSGEADELSLSYGYENYIAEAKWRTKGAASFRKLGGRRKRGVTRRDSSRASFREIFHSTPRRPCYTAVPRDKR